MVTEGVFLGCDEFGLVDIGEIGVIDFWGLVSKYFSPCGVALAEGIVSVALGLSCIFSFFFYV